MAADGVIEVGGELVPVGKVGTSLPAIVTAAGGAAVFVWEEFFTAQMRNPHTRRAYTHAVRRFLAWAEGMGLELGRISPGLVAQYLDGLQASVPTRKLHLAALTESRRAKVTASPGTICFPAFSRTRCLVSPSWTQ